MTPIKVLRGDLEPIIFPKKHQGREALPEIPLPKSAKSGVRLERVKLLSDEEILADLDESFGDSHQDVVPLDFDVDSFQDDFSGDVEDY